MRTLVAPRAAARLGVVLSLAALVSAAATHARGPTEALEAGAPRLEQGRRVYEARCYFCHGYAGDARTVASTFLDPPPRDFSALAPGDLARAAMLAAVRDGRPGTAMQGFAGLLDEAAMAAVVDYVRDAFMARKARPARYHSPANGWTGTPRGSPAAPFVTGAVSRDTSWDSLTEAERRGRDIYDAACVICHARGDTRAGRSPWQPQALSNDHVYDPDAVGHHDDYSDPPFGLHATAPVLSAPVLVERRGEALYQANCAFCHAADGSGRNWIGAFLVPAPPDFTRPSAAPPSADDLLGLVGRGVPGTSMPAWDGVLDDGDLRAVVAYLRAAFPAFETRDSRAP